ncbi:MAG: pyridoxal phosphate-dependent aminotransferase [Dichotomicrobium sp.]
MSDPQASRRARIDSFVAMDVMSEANRRGAAGEDIVHMEIGQPATPAPQVARDAVRMALDSGVHGYTDATGLPELRARIAQYYQERHAIEVAPERIVVTTGSSAGFALAFLMLFDTGDALGLPQPGYPCYRHIAAALGLRPVAVEAGPAEQWVPTPRVLEEAGATAGDGLDGLIVASPANPTGTMLGHEDLATLIDYCRARGVWFISDEIYHGLEHTIDAQTALRFSDDAIVVNSLSKYYCMTGWRVGWMVVPERLLRAAERLQQNLYICAPALSQIAATAAFDATAELDEIKAGYARNRAHLLSALSEAGLGEMAPADGAFYIYADVSHLTDDSRDFAARALSEAGVAITPGIDFDPEGGHRYVRLCYAGSFAEMKKGAVRLGEWLSGRSI